MSFLRKSKILIVSAFIFSLFAIAFSVQSVFADASQEITVRLDGDVIPFDVNPKIINGRTMVPLRSIFEALDATVLWDADTQTVTSSKDDTTISITIDSAAMYINNEETALDAPACIIDGRTFVPLKAVSNAFGLEVLWDDEIKCVFIFTSIQEDDPMCPVYSLDGRKEYIPQSQVATYAQYGWYAQPMVALYALDGRIQFVPESEKEIHQTVGWYLEPMAAMYSVSGEVRIVPATEVKAYIVSGWYTEPITIMYALDDKTQVVPNSEVEKYIQMGWYFEPVVLMYSLDGRTQVVAKSLIEANKAVGWYYGDISTGNTHLDALIDKALAQCTNSGMTMAEKLRAAYLYIRDTYTYLSRPHQPRGATEFAEESAIFMFENGKGNCYCFASCFMYMAQRIGFRDATVVSGGVGHKNDDHAWVMIDSKIYDVELEYAHRYRYAVQKIYDLYAMSIDNTPFPYHFPN